jgi:beta-glucosidase
VAVAAKQTAHVDIAVPARQLRYWDTVNKQYVVEAGDYEILVGAASDDIRAKLAFRVGGK